MANMNKWCNCNFAVKREADKLKGYVMPRTLQAVLTSTVDFAERVKELPDGIAK
jgi:hypothetical protein